MCESHLGQVTSYSGSLSPGFLICQVGPLRERRKQGRPGHGRVWRSVQSLFAPDLCPPGEDTCLSCKRGARGTAPSLHTNPPPLAAVWLEGLRLLVQSFPHGEWGAGFQRKYHGASAGLTALRRHPCHLLLLGCKRQTQCLLVLLSQGHQCSRKVSIYT